MFKTIEISDLEYGRFGKRDQYLCRVHSDIELERGDIALRMGNEGVLLTLPGESRLPPCSSVSVTRAARTN